MRKAVGATASVVVASLLAIAAASCDPGRAITLQINNRTGRAIDVTVPVEWCSSDACREPGIDVTVEPGEVRTAKLRLATGDYAGPVRAFAGGELIFCQKYDFYMSDNLNPTWSIFIDEGHVAC